MAQTTIEEPQQAPPPQPPQAVAGQGALQGAVPQPGPAVALDRSATRAMDSMRSTFRDLAVAAGLIEAPPDQSAGRPRPGGVRIVGETILLGPPVPETHARGSYTRMAWDSMGTTIAEIERLDYLPPEERYAAMAAGHDAPSIIYSQEQADGYALEAESRVRRNLPALLSDEALDGYVQQALPLLDAGVIGDDIYQRFTQTPPVVTAGASNTGEAGMYFGSTNSIHFARAAPNFRTEDDSMVIVVHEMLHYSAFLGGGLSPRWRDGGKPVFPSLGWAVTEGGTEYFAQLLARDAGYSPQMVAYPEEVCVWAYLGKLLGDDSEKLRLAYLSGDFTEVRTLIDARLGAGAFNTLMSKDSATAARQFLEKSMLSAGIDFHQWDSDPIISAAGAARGALQNQTGGGGS